ncbi:MAG: acetyl-CoA C-acyltransferase, partial [Candidatus Thermoplasmatota archaeon]|nr:acetyl-CoA C-acyltransferase [Candidatus Thermoplasmatota archaeon]
RKLMEKMKVGIDHFDLVEHNEAFSIASIVVRDQLKIEESRFNVNGGAIAIGHPLGNSGSRIVVTLVHALRRQKMKTGLATLCHGGGGAHSMAIETL